MLKLVAEIYTFLLTEHSISSHGKSICPLTGGPLVISSTNQNEVIKAMIMKIRQSEVILSLFKVNQYIL